MKYSNLRNDWKCYTTTKECNSFFKKVKRVKNNPGMKMVLMHRLINEMPKYLFFIKYIFKFFYFRMMYKYGIDLPLNLEFGNNLRIYHWGGIVINPNSKLGNNVTIMHQVTIGNNMKNNECPVISDGVFIGIGAKVIGDIFLAKNVKVGANSVVTKTVNEVGATVIGMPAYILKRSNYKVNNLE